MTSLLNRAPTNIMEVLRGERDERPLVNTEAVAGLRHTLESGLATLLDTITMPAPLIVRPSSFSSNDGLCPSPSLAQARGALIGHCLQLLTLNEPLTHEVESTIAAWRDLTGDATLAEFLTQLSLDERARLAADVDAHRVTLTRALGSVSPHWQPRTSLRAYQRCLDGRVILRDVVDLMVGTTAGDVASVALLDVTTAPLGESAEKVLRYHALVQTLRTGVVPLRSSVFSSATGELWCREVDDELLQRAVSDVLHVIEALRP